MSSGTVTPPSPPQAPVAPPTEYEVVIEQRLRQTRRHVSGVDLAAGLITLAIGVLAFLLAATMFDHWVFAGGLGFWGRMLLWLVLVGAVGVYFTLQLLPPLVHRINPVFAAAAIEKSQPSLKNSLINFLLLRDRRREVAAPVYHAMEYRAAVDLSRVQPNTAIDRSHVIRRGYVLLGVVAVCILYFVFSARNPLPSAARVLWPWSSIEAPTRVTIRDVQPGDAVALYGDSLTVSAEISGLRKDEPALLIYSTADGETVDQKAPLKRPEGGYRYECQLPPGNLGLQQDYRYYLTAGDYRTPTFRIDVQIAPALAVDQVSYHYPAYTGIADQTIERQGDLQAIEGTEVTIRATANTDIKPGTAEVDLGCNGRQAVKMNSDRRTAIGHFTLRMACKGSDSPEFDCYQLRFADLGGRQNTRPIRYRIDVLRDLPPEVQLLEPQESDVKVTENGKLAIRVRAEDSDSAFSGLRRVTLRAQRSPGGSDLPIPPLLERKAPDKPWPGEFSSAYNFEPRRLGLKAGDRVQYWAEAEDNKEPEANRSTTDKQWITVVASDSRRQPQQTPEGQGDRQQTDKSSSRPGNSDEQSGSDQQSKDGAADKQPSSSGQTQKEVKTDQQGSSSEQKDSAGQPDSSTSGQSESSKSGQTGGDSSSAKSGQDKAQQGGGDADKTNQRPSTPTPSLATPFNKSSKIVNSKTSRPETKGRGIKEPEIRGNRAASSPASSRQAISNRPAKINHPASSRPARKAAARVAAVNRPTSNQAGAATPTRQSQAIKRPAATRRTRNSLPAAKPTPRAPATHNPPRRKTVLHLPP